MKANQTFSRKLLATAISTATTLTATAAMAQTEALEEVIVTATARAQSVTDIPFNISAIQGEDIAARQIFTETELF